RVVDAAGAVGERVVHRQHEAGRELAQRTARVHERRRVRLETTLRHQFIELVRRLLDLLVRRPVLAVRLGDRRRDAPEHVLWRLDRLARLVLDQVTLLENGARVLGQRRRRGGRVYGERHCYFSNEGYWAKPGAIPAMIRQGSVRPRG